MKLIWTYSSKLNRSSQIKNEDMLSLYKTSIEYGSKYHFTRVYTDESSKDFFEGLVDNVVVLPNEFDYYFFNSNRFDAIFVKDISTAQRKWIYSVLTEKGFDKKRLYRLKTTFSKR